MIKISEVPDCNQSGTSFSEEIFPLYNKSPKVSLLVNLRNFAPPKSTQHPRGLHVSYPTLKILGFLVLRGLRLANRQVRLLSRYGDSYHWCSFCFPHPTLSFFTPMLLLQNGFQDTLRIRNTLEHDICPPTSGDMKISGPDDSLPPSTVRAYNGDVVVTDENIFPSPETVPDHNPVRH